MARTEYGFIPPFEGASYKRLSRSKSIKELKDFCFHLGLCLRFDAQLLNSAIAAVGPGLSSREGAPMMPNAFIVDGYVTRVLAEYEETNAFRQARAG